MINASDLRAGMTFVQDGKLIKVLDASHHKPGKGNTVMRMKLRDVRTGSTYDTTFRPEEKLKKRISIRKLYNTYIQWTIPHSLWIWKPMNNMKFQLKWLKKK